MLQRAVVVSNMSQRVVAVSVMPQRVVVFFSLNERFRFFALYIYIYIYIYIFIYIYWKFGVDSWLCCSNVLISHRFVVHIAWKVRCFVGNV
jgi:hypothetical protein